MIPGRSSKAPAPACSLTSSRGPGGEHTLTLAGEGRAPGREHILRLAGEHGVAPGEAGRILDEVGAAVDRRRACAGEAGVPRRTTAEIAAWLQRYRQM